MLIYLNKVIKNVGGKMNICDEAGKKCVGCQACVASCPKGCITIESNEEGFLYPKVDEELCVQCGICKKACPALSEADRVDIYKSKAYGVRPKKEYYESVRDCASGGVFFYLAKKIIEDGGCVFGAAFDEGFVVRHVCAENMDELIKLRNSKYVQSDMTGVYPLVKDKLELFKEQPNKKVMFSGTPCQCEGLVTFLGKDYDNLIVVDMLCHGVPSPLAFRKYLKYLEGRFNEKVNDFSFRAKHRGWGYKGYMTSYSKFNNHVMPAVKDEYMCAFFKRANYRESCYTCSYNVKKSADITLGDFSKVLDVMPEFYTKAGCSEAFVNTLKGDEYMRLLSDFFEIVELDTDNPSVYGSVLSKKTVRRGIRDTIYDGIDTMRDAEYVSKRLKPTVSIKGIIMFYMPGWLKKRLKLIKKV